jgi:hypothetical protein
MKVDEINRGMRVDQGENVQILSPGAGKQAKKLKD